MTPKKHVAAAILAATVSFLTGNATRAEVAVTIEHNAHAAATDAFRFKTVPAPRSGATAGAAFTILDGAADPNGASLDALHDGKLPGDEDQADANFFFAQGTDGGRLLVDLGKVISVGEVETYSWHPDTRGPQVYALYGSDGNDRGFVARPRRPQDPAQAGWKLVARVDTRPKSGESGGQYGVRIADAAGAIGNYRYLLFDVSRTENDDPFGNTFYSEIDIIDRDAPAPANPAPTPRTKETLNYDRDSLRLTFTNDDPTFDPKVRDRMVETFFAVYPPMTHHFNENAPKAVRIAVETKYHGIAATAGGTIHVNPKWLHDHPPDTDIITHEGMHVVQQYRQWQPGWLTEGIADYARYKFGVGNRDAGWSLPDYQPGQNYDNSYRVTARFLAWLEKHVKPGVVQTLDRSMRDATYTPGTWKQLTGKSVEELWQDYARNPSL